jgi:hypothetical protein
LKLPIADAARPALEPSRPLEEVAALNCDTLEYTLNVVCHTTFRVYSLPMQKGEDFFKSLTQPDQYATYKAACLLADRYREERDAARAEVAKLKKKLALAKGEQPAAEKTVQAAISKALGLKS